MYNNFTGSVMLGNPMPHPIEKDKSLVTTMDNTFTCLVNYRNPMTSFIKPLVKRVLMYKNEVIIKVTIQVVMNNQAIKSFQRYQLRWKRDW